MENKSKLRDWWWWCVYVCSYPMDYAEDDEADMVREGLPRDGRQEEGTVFFCVCLFGVLPGRGDYILSRWEINRLWRKLMLPRPRRRVRHLTPSRTTQQKRQREKDKKMATFRAKKPSKRQTRTRFFIVPITNRQEDKHRTWAVFLRQTSLARIRGHEIGTGK